MGKGPQHLGEEGDRTGGGGQAAVPRGPHKCSCVLVWERIGVGELGIAQNPNWPFDGPNGHWPDLLAECL